MAWRQVLREAALVRKVDVKGVLSAASKGSPTLPLHALLAALADAGIELTPADAAALDARFGDAKRQHVIDHRGLWVALGLAPPPGFKDPEAAVDALPQPYRMINKVVAGVVDAAWRVLKSHAARPTVDQHRASIPRVGHSVALSDCVPEDDVVTAVSTARGGSRVVFGTAAGTVAIVSARSGSVLSCVDAFPGVGGGVALLPAMTPAPAFDTDPSALPSPDLSPPGEEAPPEPVAKQASEIRKKGVGFADEAEKPAKAKPKPMPPSWAWDARERGLLVAVAANAVPTPAGADAGEGADGDGDGEEAKEAHPTGTIHVYHFDDRAAMAGFLDEDDDAGSFDGEAEGVAWRHLCTMATPDAVASIQYSPDARYLSAILDDGAVHVFHMHASVVKPPPPAAIVDEAEEAAKAAAKALLGSDSEAEEEETAEAASVTVDPPVNLAPVLVIPPAPEGALVPDGAVDGVYVAKPRCHFVAAPLHTPHEVDMGGGEAPEPAGPERSVAGSVRSGASRAQSRARSAATGMTGGGGGRRRPAKGDPADLGPPLQLAGSDLAPVTCGVVLWWDYQNRLQKYALPTAALDPIRNPAPATEPPPVDDPPQPVTEWVLAGAVTASAVDASGRYVVTGCEDGGVTVWDSRAGTVRAVCERHSAAVTAAGFCGASAEYVVSGCAAGRVHIYHLDGSVADAPPPQSTNPMGLIGGTAVWPPSPAHPNPLLRAMRDDGVDAILQVVAFDDLPVAVVAARQTPVSHEPAGASLGVYVYDVVHGEVLASVRPARVEPGTGIASGPDCDWVPTDAGASGLRGMLVCAGSTLVVPVRHRSGGTGDLRALGYFLPDLVRAALPALEASLPDATAVEVFTRLAPMERTSQAAVAAALEAIDRASMPNLHGSTASLRAALSPSKSVTFSLPASSKAGSRAASPTNASRVTRRSRRHPTKEPPLFAACPSTNPADLVQCLMHSSAEWRDARAARLDKRQEQLLAALQAADAL